MGGKTPKAPDPYKVMQQQQGYDLQSSIASNTMRNANVVDPYGSTKYSISGWEEVAGPDGRVIKVPRYTETTTLNPETQKQLDGRNAMISQLYAQLQGNKPTIGGNFLRPEEATMATDRKRVEQSIMDRANPLLQKNRDSEVARLAAMGLVPGGEKYGRVADQAGKDANDLALGAVAAGGQEQSRLLDLYNKGTGLMKDERSNIIAQLMGLTSSGIFGSGSRGQFQGQGLQSQDWNSMVQNKYSQDVARKNQKMSDIGNIIKMGVSFI